MSRDMTREMGKEPFVAMRMIKSNKLSLEDIAMYSGLTLEQVLELEKELQSV